MYIFHSLKWLRGIVMELGGVGLIIWLAAGLPGVPGNTASSAGRPPASPPASEASREPASAAEARKPVRAAWRWLGDWRSKVAVANSVPDTPLPTADARVAYTQARLEPAGRALRSLVDDAVAGVLRDLTTAGNASASRAGSPPTADWQP